MKQHSLKRGLLFLLAAPSLAMAGADDYIIQPKDGFSVSATHIEARLTAYQNAHQGMTITYQDTIDMPYLNFNIQLVSISPGGGGSAAGFATAATNNDLLVEADRFVVEPNAGNATTWPVTSGTAGSMFPNAAAYPTLSALVPTMVSRPEIYIVDTGIQAKLGATVHPLFDSPRVSFGLGLLATSLKLAPLDPYTDSGDHGTAVASAVAGIGGTTGPIGSLMKWPDTRCTLISARMYAPPGASSGVTGWVSDAVSAIAQSVNCHMRTWRDDVVGNEGGVLVFAHRLVNYYSPSLEMALWNAWNKGCMTVVCSAGNNLVNTIPKTPTGTMPADDVLSSVTGTTSPGRITLTWEGFTPSNSWARVLTTPAAAGDDYLIFAGGINSAATRWNAGGGVGSNAGSGIDVWAPADCVALASATSGSLVGRSGTSFSAGYTAGLAAYYLSHRPFATGPAVKKWIQTPANSLVAAGLATAPGGVVKPRLRVTSTIAPSIYCQYTDWRSDCSLGPAPTVNVHTDNDMVLNGIEFALGTHPRISDTDAHIDCSVYQPSPARMVNQAALTQPNYQYWLTPGTIRTYKSYLMGAPLSGVLCFWEMAPNLKDWSDTPLVPVSTPLRGEGYLHQGSLPLAWSAGFFRIRVTTD